MAIQICWREAMEPIWFGCCGECVCFRIGAEALMHK